MLLPEARRGQQALQVPLGARPVGRAVLEAQQVRVLPARRVRGRKQVLRLAVLLRTLRAIP